MDRSITDSDLDFWFNEVDALMGERSTMSSTLSMLQRGGATSGQYEEPFSDLKLWVWHHQHDRIQRVKERLLKLDRATYRLLEVHYTSALGVGSANGVDPRDRNRVEYVNRVRARFGDYAGVVIYLTEKLNELARLDTTKKTRAIDLFGVNNAKEIEAIAELAELELKAAHKAWRATRPKKETDAKRNYEVPLPVAS